MQLLLLLIFCVGYAAIAFEHVLKINKTAIALFTGILCWTVYILFSEDKVVVGHQLYDHLGQISGILFFLLGAMTIVELVDAYDGFEVITGRIHTTDTRKLLWIICLVTFFLSAVLDNLTTTIVMVSLLRKLVTDKYKRLFFIGMVVVAANAGGAWTPIGDVTTTMLWIGGQITTGNIMATLIGPSLVCIIVPLLILSFTMRGVVGKQQVSVEVSKPATTARERNLVLIIGVGALVFVPVFKTVTHLPPFMGMLFGLSLLWIVTELMHRNKSDEEKDSFSVVQAIRKADVPSVLFFLGILVAIAALESTGQLHHLAGVMDRAIGDIRIIVLLIGLLSAVVDNVPLVAAAMGMYDMTTYPTDHMFWEFVAYCAGTGGSCLIIGSAAGVAAMGMEKIDFFWYLKKIAWLALLGYFAGAAFFLAQHYFLNQ